MRDFDYRRRYQSLLQPDIVALMTQIHEYKGAQAFYIDAKSDALARLSENAKLQSTEASNRIEGIYTSEERLKKIVRDKTVPKTRSEKEIAGYRDVLTMIGENYDYIPLKSSVFLQLHQDLYKFAEREGGSFRSEDQRIAGEGRHEKKSMILQPVSAREVPDCVDVICSAFQEVGSDERYDPLLLIPLFLLDFLCIHPFGDGNGRMSRLLTLLLLYRAGYFAGMYISMEKRIEQTAEEYYRALRESSCGWQEEDQDDGPFVRYMLNVIAEAYREFSVKVQRLTANGISKPQRVRDIVRESAGKVTRAEIMEKCPDISQVTVERALTEMVKKGELLKIGGGRYTSYLWNREKKQDDNRRIKK